MFENYPIEIRVNRLPDGFNERLKLVRQQHLDARCAKKNDINLYVYKNSICIDAEQGFIRCFVAIPANIRNSQMLLMLFDPEHQDDFVWEYSAYSGERFKNLLILA